MIAKAPPELASNEESKAWNAGLAWNIFFHVIVMVLIAAPLLGLAVHLFFWGMGK